MDQIARGLFLQVRPHHQRRGVQAQDCVIFPDGETYLEKPGEGAVGAIGRFVKHGPSCEGFSVGRQVLGELQGQMAENMCKKFVVLLSSLTQVIEQERGSMRLIVVDRKPKTLGA